VSELKEYAVIVFEGEGHYSGNRECNTLFIKKSELTGEIRDFLSDYTPMYPELDGKHSGVAGKVTIDFEVGYTYLAEGNFYNYDKIVEVLEDNLARSSDYLIDDHLEFVKKVEVVTQVKFDGVYV